MTTRRLGFLALLVLMVVLAVASPLAAGGGTGAAVKPVIGRATSVPAAATAGQPFAVSVRVTRSDTRAPLTQGTMLCRPSAGGRAIAHTQSFRAGVGRCGFRVPSTATALTVTFGVKAAGGSATKSFSFAVRPAPKPTISIGDVTVSEGNSGTTAMSFPVTLSKASAQPVAVSYATANGTATAPSDYSAASGTLTFAAGETSKAIALSIVGDVAIEPDETLTVTLSSPVNATIARGSATGTIKNDDTQVPVTTGSWKGQLASGDFMYFEVGSDRTMSYFRLNDIQEPCSPGGYFEGSLAFPPTTKWPIAANGNSGSAGTWSGNDVEGEFTFTFEAYRVVAHFNGSSATGTFRLQDNLTYRGTNFTCDTGDVAWTAAPQ